MGTSWSRRLALLVAIASIAALLVSPFASFTGLGGQALAQDDGTPSAEPTETATDIPAPPTDTPTDTATATATDLPSDTPTSVPSDTPTLPATDTPVATSTAASTDTPTAEPSVTEEPASPSATESTETATTEPSATASPSPTASVNAASPSAPAASPSADVSLATTSRDIKVILSCWSMPELTRIENHGKDPITIISIGSRVDPASGEPYTVNRTLGAGRTVIFRSGPAATYGTVLTKNNLYFGTTSTAEGATVQTSVGTISADCGPNPFTKKTTLGQVHVTLSCRTDPELTRIDNDGDGAIVIYSIGSLADQAASEPRTTNRRLGAGHTVIFRTGHGAVSGTVLSTTPMYTDWRYDGDGVVINTNIGTITKTCPAKPIPSKLKVTVSCASSPETTTITNIGERSVTLSQLSSVYSGARYSLGNKTLAPGAAITYRSGASSGTNLMTSNEIYNDDAGSADGARIQISNGKTFKALCANSTKWIEVNLSTQTLYAWLGNKLVATSLVSSGKDGYETPTGTFSINSKPGTIDMSGCSGDECWYVPAVPASMAFTYEGHYLHGAYWHNLFGIARLSHGCVNLPVSFAWWLFDWTPMWTKVVIHY